MSRRHSSRVCVLLLCASLAGVACATPPSREMDQAQGAIDAARAAGADRYAAEQYQSAVKALASAHDAVAQRDYRLALNYALESRDRAQTAAKEAATQQAAMRSAAERRLGEVTARLDQVKQRFAAAEKARVARRSLVVARSAIADAESSVQKAGTDIQAGNYQESQNRLSESAKKLDAAIAEIDTATKPRGARR